MLSLWLLPLGFLLLTQNKSRKSPKAISAASGLKFSCERIEVVNKTQVNVYIDDLIHRFRRAKKVSRVEDLNILDVFQFIVSNLNKLCYSRLENRTFSERQKMVCMLLFTLVFNRMASLSKDANKFFENFEDYEQEEIWHYLDFTEEDYSQIFPKVLEDFNKNYSYPI